MSKRPSKPKREDFNEAAFRVVREATEEHEPGSPVQKVTRQTEAPPARKKPEAEQA
jgi:hypothetical protein